MKKEYLKDMLESLAVGDRESAGAYIDRWLLEKAVSLNTPEGVEEAEGDE